MDRSRPQADSWLSEVVSLADEGAVEQAQGEQEDEGLVLGLAEPVLVEAEYLKRG